VTAILVALLHDVTNARTEGFNRIIKQTKRVGCGYRNMINYQRRILSHIAVTRPQKNQQHERVTPRSSS
jgi:transposase